MSLLRIDRLEKTFFSGGHSERVLDRLSLELQPGERVALLGPSGSGKTTLLNLIAGLERPDRGEICLADLAYADLDENGMARLRREKLGVVFQFFNLVPTLTVLENLLLPLSLVGRTGGQACARRLLAEVGLADREGRFPDELSGGEQQRVAICRALVHAPALVLADEPTGNLDNRTADEVITLLLGQVGARGQALLLVTHNEAYAARADRVLRLHEGQLQAEAPEPSPC